MCYIYQFQAVQVAVNKVQFRIVLDDEFSKNEFVEWYHGLLDEAWSEGMEFEFTFMEKILSKNSTGKVCWFWNEMV